MPEDRFPATPKEISEYLLAETGGALESGDFERFRKCFLLPQEAETFDTTIRLEDDAALLQVFRSVRAFHNSIGATDLIRVCIEAEFLSPQSIGATHVSRLMRDGILLHPAYPVYSVLQLIDGEWKIAHSKYALDGAVADQVALSAPEEKADAEVAEEAAGIEPAESPARNVRNVS